MATSPPEQDPFELLGVSEASSEEAIDDAWRHRMKRCHPDFAADEADRRRRLAESVALNRAHDVLTDRALRQQAIRARHSGVRMDSPPGRPAAAPKWADGVWDGTNWSRTRWSRQAPVADPLPVGASTPVRVWHIVRRVFRWAVWQVICLLVPARGPSDSEDP